MRWPLVTRKRHDREIEMMTTAIKNEHDRATREGRAQVHAWAADLNYALFGMDVSMAIGRMRGALQQAELMFVTPQLDIPSLLEKGSKVAGI